MLSFGVSVSGEEQQFVASPLSPYMSRYGVCCFSKFSLVGVLILLIAEVLVFPACI
jgi:hypothetical protein